MGALVGWRSAYGFAWETTGVVGTAKARGRRRKIRTPKRYPRLQPFSAHEREVIRQLAAFRKNLGVANA